MPLTLSCNTSSLSAYIPSTNNPWNAEKINHLYRRLHYGASNAEIAAALSQSPEQLIDQIIDEALATPPMTPPSWATLSYQGYIDAGLDPDEEIPMNHEEMRLAFFNAMYEQGLKGRLTLFWSNHFVTELETYYCSNYLFDYYQLLQTHAIGNFQDFVRAIGINEAMLVYLNGYENTANSPNENYARELYELFSLGVNNGYTQTDIVETAKALTGYNYATGFCEAISFFPNTFNAASKTIFGQTGNWGYNDVIDILFQERSNEIAEFICKKLYAYFVSPEINTTIVSELAGVFVQDFNIANVLRTLFKSEHFFDETAIGTQIKSPFDLSLNFLKVANFTLDETLKPALIYLSGIAGQELFNPVDVAGWQGNHDWINSSTLTGRWEIMQYMVVQFWNTNFEELRSFAIETSNNSLDPFVVTKSIIDRFIPKALHTTTDYDIATDIFKYNIPQNYYDDQLWNLYTSEAPFQVALLLLHIVKMPEFQLK